VPISRRPKRSRVQKGEIKIDERRKEQGKKNKMKRKKWGEKNGKSVILPVGLYCAVSYYSLGEKCILRPFPGLTHL